MENQLGNEAEKGAWKGEQKKKSKKRKKNTSHKDNSDQMCEGNSN